ncbi:MAG: DUF3008 family protein [Bacteroides sp.]|nr:DUF3008 family protein [Bacteroides sp.]
MGAALSYIRGESKTASEDIKKVAGSMSEKELEEYASKPKSSKKGK